MCTYGFQVFFGGFATGRLSPEIFEVLVRFENVASHFFSIYKLVVQYEKEVSPCGLCLEHIFVTQVVNSNLKAISLNPSFVQLQKIVCKKIKGAGIEHTTLWIKGASLVAKLKYMT